MATITKAMKHAIENNGMKVFGNLVRIDGELFPLPLVQGNEKLGKTVYHASTLPTTGTFEVTFDGETVTETGTCPTDCDECYACKGHYQRDSVIYWLIMRTKLLREHMTEYFTLVDIQLTYQNVSTLRIHASGDFITGEASGYITVLEKHPDVEAWTYTKRPVTGEIKALDDMPNCNVVKSCIKGHGYNYGHVPYIAATYYALKREGFTVHICKCGVDKNQHCEGCHGCIDNEYVLFVEHSTGYDPTTDYGWDRFVELVNNQ